MSSPLERDLVTHVQVYITEIYHKTRIHDTKKRRKGYFRDLVRSLPRILIYDVKMFL
jgi:hypothetical protein